MDRVISVIKTNRRMAATPANEPMLAEEGKAFDIVAHGHKDVVQAIAFNAYGDRCATGSVDGKIRVFNRHRDGVWRMCDNWGAHGGEILEVCMYGWMGMWCFHLIIIIIT